MTSKTMNLQTATISCRETKITQPDEPDRFELKCYISKKDPSKVNLDLRIPPMDNIDIEASDIFQEEETDLITAPRRIMLDSFKHQNQPIWFRGDLV